MEKQTVINILKKNGYERFEDNHYVKGATSVNLEENSVMGFGGVQEVFQSFDELLNYLGLKEHTEKQTVFIKRYIGNGERPEKSGIYITDSGFNQYRNERFDLDPKWWLQEIELPSEEEIESQINTMTERSFDALSNHYCRNTADFILNKLKGE